MNEIEAYHGIDLDSELMDIVSDETKRELEKLVFTPAPKLLRKKKQVNGGIVEFEHFKLLDEYDPKLKEKSINWDFNNPPGDLRYISISLLETMVKNGGVGLAAVQVGLLYNIFAFGGGGYANVVVNPKILSADGEELIKEGCLSYPGLFLNIKRANHIDVEYYDMNGSLNQRTFEGLTARIFLHEYDHLQGITFDSLVPKITLQRERDKRKSNLKKIKKATEVQRSQQKIAHLTKQAKALEEQSSVVAIPPPNPKILPTGTIDLSTLK